MLPSGIKSKVPKLPFKQKYRTNVHVTHKQFLSQKGIKNHG
nr:MAG TPA: hypothetical protein [Caudoviricetes sp.]